MRHWVQVMKDIAKKLEEEGNSYQQWLSLY
jgi:hypothetical protein